MQRKYRVVTLDHHIIGEGIPAECDNGFVTRALERVTYRPLLRNWLQRQSDGLFVRKDSYNESLEAEYRQMTSQSHIISPCGELRFEKIWCLGRDGLRVDIDNGVVFIGPAVNWGRDYLNWWLENGDIGFDRWLSENSFLADFGEVDRHHDDIIMMKYPGYEIFGHWLLDYYPQLYLSRYMSKAASTTFVFDHLSGWMASLVEAAGIAQVDCYRHRLTEHRNLRMPTGLKNGYALSQPINSLAWSELRAYFNHLNSYRPPTGIEKLFISRRKWSGARGLSNYDELEQLMLSLGFEIYNPEQFSLQDQAHHFSHARVIVGEDGSGLHSILFSDPGAVLGVLMQEGRSNLWHAGICEAMGHSLAYYKINLHANGAMLDMGAVKTFVLAIQE